MNSRYHEWNFTDIILKTVIKSQEKRTKEEKGKKKTYEDKSKIINKMTIGTYISIITLSENGLNAPTKDRLAEWIQKQDPYIFLPTRHTFQI